MRKWPCFPLMVVCAVVFSCSHSNSDTTPVPRPTAYPRIALYDSVYVAPDSLPCGFEVNASAMVRKSSSKAASSPGSIWLAVEYPLYKAVLHCTFTPVDRVTVRRLLATRSERMALNLGNNRAEVSELASADGNYYTVVVSTGGVTLTPLQFVTEGREWVVSGALRFDADDLTPDSIRPVVEAVKQDVLNAALKFHD